MAIEQNNDSNSVKARDLALQAVVGNNPYILIEIETLEGAEESSAHVSTTLSREQVADVLFGLLAQLSD